MVRDSASADPVAARSPGGPDAGARNQAKRRSRADVRTHAEVKAEMLGKNPALRAEYKRQALDEAAQCALAARDARRRGDLALGRSYSARAGACLREAAEA